ncbi:MAG: AAA family ATPase [Nitrospirae bacterium]|nr:AAA family ATPase [Nitrospirota bacterium]
MFTIRSIEFIWWDYWERIKLPLDDKIVLVIGANASGKTTILDGLRTLLGKGTSSKRDYKKYAGRSRAPHTWIIGTVDNTKRGSRRPFGPQITDDKVTIACRIQRKGGEWPRDFYIRAGEVTFEELNDSSSNSLGLREYVSELERAGLSKAVSKVLSLEQGATDKLCEYSSKELLSLVYDVFGDKATLDNYEEHRRLQKEAEGELREFELKFATMKNAISEMNNRANSYLEFSSLMKEQTYLQTEAKAIGELVFYTDRIEGLRRNVRGMKTEMAAISEQIKPLQVEIADLEKKGNQMQAQINDMEKNLEEVTQGRIKNEGRKGELSSELTKLEDLANSVGHIEPENLDDLNSLLEEAMKRKGRLEDEKKRVAEEIEADGLQLASLKMGVFRPEKSVDDFSKELTARGISHCFLFEGVEVTDEKWMKAIESILRGYRYVVLLKNREDAWKAWEVGEKMRYRHFVVPDAGETKVSASKNSALSVVRLQDYIPGWIRKHLSEIYLVDMVEDGRILPPGATFVTIDGYMREKRGGRHIGIADDDFVFGAAARKRQMTSIQDRISENKSKEIALGKQVDITMHELKDLKSKIDIQSKLADYLSRKGAEALWKGELQEILNRITVDEAEYKLLKENIAALRGDKEDAMEEMAGKNNSLSNLMGSLTEKQQSFSGVRKEYLDNIKKFREHRAKIPLAWKTTDSIASYKQKFGDIKSVERDLEKVKEKIEKGTWETDPAILDLKEKMEKDFVVEQENLQKKQGEFENTKQAVQKAREAYQGMLRFSVDLYEKNLRSLASLAGVDIDVSKPHIFTEEELREAGISVRWNFDGKGFAGTDDGESSGGQQVIKSLILLIALMMDTRSKGGFIFIDEPFAHLDIFNIDRVSDFLRATETQFIITSPNTHNLNVYRPAGLCINTKKKPPHEKYAPVPTHIRRDARA